MSHHHPPATRHRRKRPDVPRGYFGPLGMVVFIVVCTVVAMGCTLAMSSRGMP